MNEFESLDSLIDQVKRTLEIFTKNPNRSFKTEYILNKITIKKDLQKQFSEAIRHFDVKDKIIVESKIELFKNYCAKLSLILDEKSHEILNTSKLSDDNIDIYKKITDMEFDIATSMRIIPEFNADLANFNNFCNIVEYLYDTLKTESKPKLLEFVLRTKISEKIRSKLIGLPPASNLVSFKANFSKVLKSNRSSLVIQAELSRTRQGNLPLSDFSTKIENLLAELNNVQISQQGNEFKDIIIRINDEIALNAFKCGLSDNLKYIILASRPKTLNEAINLALEADISTHATETVLAFNSNHSKKYDKSSSSKSNKFCNYCKKKGHEIKECYKRKNADSRSKRVNHIESSENEIVPEELASGSQN